MAQTVTTELVIDSNTAGADQFSQAMDRAGSSAQQGVGSVAGLTLAVAGVGVAFVGALVGLRSFVDYVGNQSQVLVDMADHAQLAGMNVKEFQETLFAARSKGITEKDFIAGLDKIGADLIAASRGVTEFGKLFEANGISIKNANGEVKNAKQGVADLAGLMQNASPQIQQAIAKIAGVSASWVPFLKQGVEGIEAQKKAAADLGVIIDDDMIAKAKEFNSQWKTAVATWDLQFKASLASILPLLVQAANLASTIIQGVGNVSGSVGRWMTPDDQKSSTQLNDQINEAYRLREMVEKLGDIGTDSFKGLEARKLAGSLNLPEDSDLDRIDRYLRQLEKMYDDTQKLVRVPVSKGTTVLPDTGADANDAVDRALNTLRRHTEQQIADTKAMGMGAEAQAKFRAEAALTSAIQANDGEITAKQRAEYEKLALAAVAAAGALARARVQNEIRFGQSTSLLSPDDVAIARQLKDIYPDVAQALGSVQAAGIRTNSALSSLSSSLSGTLTTGLADIFDGTKKLNQGFADMAKIFARAVEEMVIKLMIVQPLMRALQTSFSGFGLGSIFGGGASPTPGVDGLAAIHHTGGIVGGDGMPMRIISPAYFDDAPRFHSGGIAGDEVPIIAKRGEGVFTQGQMAAMGGGGSQGVHVSVGVTVDDAGGLKAYVKSVSQDAAAQGIQGFVNGPTFPGIVGAAAVKAKSRRMM